MEVDRFVAYSAPIVLHQGKFSTDFYSAYKNKAIMACYWSIEMYIGLPLVI